MWNKFKRLTKCFNFKFNVLPFLVILFIITVNVVLATDSSVDKSRWLIKDFKRGAFEWKYTVDMPRSDWFKTDFNDKLWKTGKSAFGDLAQTKWQSDDIWLRTSFDYDGEAFESASLFIFHDDDVVIYLNGQEIFKRSGYLTDYKYFSITENIQRCIKKGENVVAVHCLQTIGGQFLDIGLVLDKNIVDYPSEFKVTSQEMTKMPISEMLYSHFIELGYGVQVEPMWAEMLYNRSFEKFFAYRNINISWYDLWNDESDISKGYKTDWSTEDWYHSGYEHNPWFACPGDGGEVAIDENSTFIIKDSPEFDVKITGFDGGCGHGKQCMKITNNEPIKWAGIAQEGKLFKSGKGYQFRGLFKNLKGKGNAEIRVYPKGNWEKPLNVVSLEKITGVFKKQSIEFYNASYDGWVTFCIYIEPGSEILVDDFSLMPNDNINGWRPEVIEVSKRVNPGVVRYPGGCFASFYYWRDGIGPHENRQPQPSYFWGGLNYNDVGVDELGAFCNAIGSEAMYCVNMYHPLKRDYDHYFDETMCGPHGRNLIQFTDIEKGVNEAADLVAYCNLPVGTHPMADLRAKNGYTKPFGIKFWEMENEVHRWFTPEEYAKTVVMYSKAMKAIDPSIQIGLETYGERPEIHIAYHEALQQMLEIAGKHIDFLADRRDSEGGLDYMLGEIQDYNSKNGTNIRYCETEWLAYEGAADVQNRFDYEGEITKSFMFSKWYYAMNIFKNYMSWQRRGGDVMYVNFNNFANTHSQCVIDTPKEDAYLTASGKVFELLSRSPAAWPLVIYGYKQKVADEFQVQAAWDKERKRLILYVVNRTSKERAVRFNLTEIGHEFRITNVSQLSANSLFDMVTLDNQNEIKRIDECQDIVVGDEYSIAVSKYSFTQIILQ